MLPATRLKEIKSSSGQISKVSYRTVCSCVVVVKIKILLLQVNIRIIIEVICDWLLANSYITTCLYIQDIEIYSRFTLVLEDASQSRMLQVIYFDIMHLCAFIYSHACAHTHAHTCKHTYR